MAVVGTKQGDGFGIAPEQPVFRAGRAEGETANEKKVLHTESDSHPGQNNGRGLPSQMMKGRPS